MSTFREIVEATYGFPQIEDRAYSAGQLWGRDLLKQGKSGAEIAKIARKKHADRIRNNPQDREDALDWWLGVKDSLKQMGESFVKTRQPHQRMRTVVVPSKVEQRLRPMIEQLGTIWETKRSGGKTSFMIATRWYPQQLEDCIPGVKAYEEWE